MWHRATPLCTTRLGSQGIQARGGGLFIALELAEQAYQAHSLRYEPGLPKMHLYDPWRFTWVYDESGEAENCVKLRDNNTGRLVIWPWF